MMLIIISLLLLPSLIISVSFFQLPPQETEWELFKIKYKRKYNTTVEEEIRKKIYFNNKQIILDHNYEFHKNNFEYSLEINEFSDLLPVEFISVKNGYMGTQHYTENLTPVTFIPPFNVTIPNEIDWRKLGAVTEVKDQKNCGSCWAFSATGSIEGQNFRKINQLISLSEQNLIDCSRKYGNEGCNGGLMNQAFEYVKENNGIDTEEYYPYKGKNGKCHCSLNNVGATVTGFVDIPKGNETYLKIAVAKIGPISVAIDASHFSFQFYSKDHGVLVVGYGTDDKSNADYWIIKNSWGTNWGMSGYMLLARNRHNHCGVATAASYPLV